MSDPSFFRTGYDLTACEIGVVHIGFGAFHRAHQAMYLDDYMQATGDLRWGIAAVNLRAGDSAAFSAAAASRDGYLLKSISPDGSEEFRAVRSHRAFIDATQDFNSAIDLWALPSVNVCTITVTESGYHFSEDWNLDLSAAPIRSELSGGPVQSLYGYLTAALARRAEVLGKPINILCCDNIRNNGNVLKRALLSYIRASNQHALADWVNGNVAFPCSMVDRITPRSTPSLRAEVERAWPEYAATAIHAEDFRQWVLENDFAAPMPDLSKVGVEIVEDVLPYEEAKIRILNGGHTGLTYLGALAGHETFDAAMRDPVLRAHFDAWEQHEVLPGLGDGFPFDTARYLAEIARRFENPGIADQLERICMDGFSKMAIYIRPTLEACLQKGIIPQAGYDCVASWVVFARKFRAGETHFPYHEPFWDKLEPLLPGGQEQALATEPMLWADLPRRFDGFVPNLAAAIQRMDEKWQA